MAICTGCMDSVCICGDSEEKGCSICGAELSNPANKICKKCAGELDYCEQCAKPMDHPELAEEMHKIDETRFEGDDLS